MRMLPHDEVAERLEYADYEARVLHTHGASASIRVANVGDEETLRTVLKSLHADEFTLKAIDGDKGVWIAELICAG